MYQQIKMMFVIVTMLVALFGCDRSMTSQSDVEQPIDVQSAECSDDGTTKPISPFDSTPVKGCAIDE